LTEDGVRTHEQTVQSQFDPRAQAYLTSAVHAAGPDLERAKGLVAQAVPATSKALDLGCGGGHLSFALAPYVARMVALDPSQGMLTAVAESALARGLTQIEVREGSAEALPFPDCSFDLVCTRYSAHHWTRLDAAVRDLARVLKTGGHALIIDTLGQEDALVDTFMQSIELLRDPSHVRNRTVTEWRSLLRTAGLVELERAEWPIRLEFASWVARMRTPPDRVAVIRSLQEGAPREVRQALEIEADGSFAIQTGLFWLRKPA
jgi:ubiquinone/menaquinone biosynthesis C-methylase UbiE